MRDEQVLDLLSTLHYVAAGLTAVTACCPLLQVAFGVSMVSGLFDQADPTIRNVGWLFIALPAIAIFSGWSLALGMFLTARRLKRRRGRTWCQVVAAVECTLMPYGTALGVFTIITLSKDSVQETFRQASAAGDASAEG